MKGGRNGGGERGVGCREGRERVKDWRVSEGTRVNTMRIVKYRVKGHIINEG